MLNFTIFTIYLFMNRLLMDFDNFIISYWSPWRSFQMTSQLLPNHFAYIFHIAQPSITTSLGFFICFYTALSARDLDTNTLAFDFPQVSTRNYIKQLIIFVCKPSLMCSLISTMIKTTSLKQAWKQNCYFSFIISLSVLLNTNYNFFIVLQLF